MDVGVVQKTDSSVDEHGVFIVRFDQPADESSQARDSNNDVAPPVHALNRSELTDNKTEHTETATEAVTTDRGITVENKNDIVSDQYIVPDVVKTEEGSMSVSTHTPEPDICLPVVDAEMATCPPQPPTEESREDYTPFGEVSGLSMENGESAMINPDAASQPATTAIEIQAHEEGIPVCFPAEDDMTAPQPYLVQELREDTHEHSSETQDSVPPFATRLPVEDSGLMGAVTPEMADTGSGLAPDKVEVEVTSQEVPPPEHCNQAETVAVSAAPDITEDKSDVFLPGVSDSWLEGDKSNDSIHGRGESRVKFLNSFEIATSPDNTPATKPEEVTPVEPDVNYIGVMTPEEEYQLRRSTSMESRDNPFIPDGELSKETDELLKRATVIRDTFILDEAEQRRRDSQNLPNDINVMSATASVEPPVVVQETVVVAASAKPASATPDKKAKKNKKEKKIKENGKVEDSVTPAAHKAGKGGSSDKPSAAGDAPTTDYTADDGDNKKQNKCCAIM